MLITTARTTGTITTTENVLIANSVVGAKPNNEADDIHNRHN